MICISDDCSNSTHTGFNHGATLPFAGSGIDSASACRRPGERGRRQAKDASVSARPKAAERRHYQITSLGSITGFRLVISRRPCIAGRPR